jgi:hypothetical protein
VYGGGIPTPHVYQMHRATTFETQHDANSVLCYSPAYAPQISPRVPRTAKHYPPSESLVRTLVGGGVEVCFANPGTSEMHFVAALDRVVGMRSVLGLFEGVVTGAAGPVQSPLYQTQCASALDGVSSLTSG